MKIDKEKKRMFIYVGCVYLLITTTTYYLREEIDLLYAFLLFVACVIVCVSVTSELDAKHQLEKKKLELEMQSVYSDTYKELIAEVRRKQHDFTNQLGAIYSMSFTATSLEELVKKQQEYGALLIKNNRYNKMLFGCENPILAGYLYYKCVNFENDGVIVDYMINVEKAECLLPLYEVIEILGIFLTNASENYQDNATEKTIWLVIRESESGLNIEVSNWAREFAAKELEWMFAEGNSTKGDKRGLGLSRVKQLAEKVRADLIVENQKMENRNRIVFKMLIPKMRK